MSSDCDSIYRDLFIEIYKNPKNFGKLKKYDVKENIGNPSCGDNITMYLKLEGNRIKEISFEGQGCVVSIVSASILTERVKGKSIEEVEKMDAKELFEILGIDLSDNPTKARCALLSLNTLKKAVEKSKNR